MTNNLHVPKCPPVRPSPCVHATTTRRPKDKDAERVLALVSSRHRVTVKQLLHPTRSQAPIAHSRQLAMYLMHTSLGRTMTDVGIYFGRDRTTVAHACGRIEDERDDTRFDADVSALEDALSQFAEHDAGQADLH